MQKALHIYLHVHDAKWEEAKHPRAENGKFGVGSDTSAAPAKVTLKGDELGDYQSMKELRQKALAHAESFIGKKFTNAATGRSIVVPKTGVRHTIATGSDQLIKTVPAIPDLLKNGRLVKSEPDKRGDPNIIAVETYSAPIEIEGQQYHAIVKVKKYSDGRRFYDHGLIEMGAKPPFK
jgi:hypothetical protein